MVMYAASTTARSSRPRRPGRTWSSGDDGNNDFRSSGPTSSSPSWIRCGPATSCATTPGEANVRLADIVVVNKVPSAEPAADEHGVEMPYGAGTVAAKAAGAAELVDPRAFAVGSIAATFEKFPEIGAVLPAMGYGDEQLAELAATIDAADCDVVVTGTPMNLTRVIDVRHPVRHATYVLADHGEPTLADVLRPFVEAHVPEALATT